MKLIRRKLMRWIVGIILVDILLVVILIILIYLPPVQRMLVDEATEIVREETGMQVDVKSVSLAFPLDLSVNDLVVTKADSVRNVVDTIAVMESLVLDVRLMPLLNGNVVIDAFEFNGVKLNSGDLVAAARVRGTIDRFTMRSRGINLNDQKVELNGTHLKGADIEVNLLNDTTAADTSATEEARWRILADDMTVEELNVVLHTIGDTTSVRADVGMVRLDSCDIDLGRQSYSVASFMLGETTVSYDNNMVDTVTGLDMNHIALSDINISVDSILYSPALIRLNLKQFSVKEKSGLEIVQLECPLQMDSTTLHIPALKLLTPDSDMESLVNFDLDVIDEKDPGQLFVRLYASIGKEDVMRFCGDMPPAFIQQYPVKPMTIRGSVSGNMEHAVVEGFSVDLLTAFKLSVNGTLADLTKDYMRADIDIKGQTGSLSFLKPLIDADNTGTIAIPDSLTLEGNATANGPVYAIDLVARQDSGVVEAVAQYDVSKDAYKADIEVRKLQLNNFLPKDSLYTFSATATVDGEGFDAFSKNARLVANAQITELRYGSWNINNVKADATLRNGVGHAKIVSRNALANGTVSLDALMSHSKVDATFVADLGKADFHTLRITENPLTAGMCAHIDLKSDLAETHSLQGYVNDLTVGTSKKTFRPQDVLLDVSTNPDTTWAKVNTGNMALSLSTSGGYMKVLAAVDSVMNEMAWQRKNRVIDQIALQHRLPVVKLKFTSGQGNPLANMLRYNGILFDDLSLALNTSPQDGIAGGFHVYSLVTDSMQLDTVRMVIGNDSLDYMRFKAEVVNGRGNPQSVFRAQADGYLFDRNLGVDVRYFDAEQVLGIELGAHAEMRDSGIYVRLTPDSPTLGYKRFHLNKDNFIALGRNLKVRAGINLIADDGTGVKIYSTDEDNPDKLQDITLTLHKFDLGKLTSVIPYAPNVNGLLNGDFRMIQDVGQNLSMASYLSIDDMAYEKNPMGDISTEFAYLQQDDSTHMVNATINCNEREIGVLDGTYRTDGHLDAMFTMSRFPLSMANGFVPDNLLGLYGYAEGELSVKGQASKLIVDGSLKLDSTFVKSIPYGLDMRTDNSVVKITNSKLELDNFSIYGHNNKPLSFTGDIDFSNFDRLGVNMRVRARDFMLIDSKKVKGSIAYGRCYVNIFTSVRGTLDELRVRGRLEVTGKTNLTYVLKDSPLSTDDRLKELVTFTDFRDTTNVVKVKRPPIGGLDMQLTVNVVSGARVMCALNAAQTNYVSIEGGGELRMLYTPAGDLQLFGRYTVNEGEMKYALPVIPLKTFNLQEGSYIDFAGNVMNPKLNLIATEEIKSQVASPDGSTRSVLFDCGVKITQTLDNLGLEFLLDAPADMTIKNELATMGKEQKGKLAVTMLTTGIYLKDGNTGNFSMNSALSSFLQNEINNIAGSAMTSVDFSLGVDQKSDAAGQMTTDYSFKFAKRFWNNRFNLIVGVKISDCNDKSATEQNQSFIDNVSLEYRLDQTAEKNVHLFYNKDGSDLLEDDISEYGAGFVWRKKLGSLSEIFKPTTNTYNNVRRPQQNAYPATRRDSTTVNNANTK